MSTVQPEAATGATGDRVLAAVKRVVVRESRLSLDPATVPDDEPLDGRLLRVTSLGLLGMLIRLEDDLDATLPDDIFAGREIHTVADLADLVRAATQAGPS
ncbi:acyl carrier protein [Micromonospora echinofusca]|uniref:Acyl carrier protein n=1 Tax=Micromonospora echinofusca TaxID=47858 RepID=A0ABS3VJD0_MICEH|nr:acyl carrier protein [Micromonospora echinofusca]MBO4204638.1 acyl carrier protein [Micromonospora echinofusca]